MFFAMLGPYALSYTYQISGVRNPWTLPLATPFLPDLDRRSGRGWILC